jgi:putative membrane protein
MIVRRNLRFIHILHYTWIQILYYILLSTSVVLMHEYVDAIEFNIPSYTIAALGTALAIFLGFKNNHAYDRWWEARKVWGLMVNYSRTWTRQVTTLITTRETDDGERVRDLQRKIVYRHIAFVNALRVFLREKLSYNKLPVNELVEEENTYRDARPFLHPEEYKQVISKDNPPNFLLQLQGEDLAHAFKKGWLSDYRLIKLEETLVDFNDIQGMSERIKNTPLPRQYTFFSRVFVAIHCTLLPMVFAADLGWMAIPISVVVSFVFLDLDMIGERTEDPFENKLEDTPLTALSLTIEINLREQLKEPKENFPEKYSPERGVVL